MNPAVLATLYRRAAADIRTRGLAKGSYKDYRGRHCIVGALRHEMGEEGWLTSEPEYLSPLAELLGGRAQDCPCGCGLAPGGSFITVTEWNDKPERTASDVATLLEQAAEKLEAEA